MGTPVWNYAIGTVGCVAPAAIAHDRVIRNSVDDRKLVNGLDESVVRLKRVYTIRHALQCSCRRIGDEKRFRRSVDRNELFWRSNETGADAANPPGGEFAAAMWRGNEYDALNISPMIK